MKNRLSEKELRNLYKEKYVLNYHSEDKVRIRRLLNYINLRKEDDVLDAACGNGLLFDYLNEKVRSYVGVDFSEEFINVAKKRLKPSRTKSKFVVGDLVDYCKKRKDKFDKVFSLDFTEHIYDDQFQKIFSAIKYSLKKNGQLIIHTPNAEYIMEILKEKGILKQFSEHIGIRDAKYHHLLLSKVGFKKIKIIHLSHYIKIFSVLDFLRYLPYFGKYFKARLLIICQK